MFVIAGKTRFEPSMHDALVDVLAKLSRNSRSEHGCLAYWFAEDVGEPGIFRFFACWQDDASLAAHQKAPHYVEYLSGDVKPDVVEVARYEVSDMRFLVSG